MELLVPRPLCEVVNCDVEIDVEAALAQLGRGLFRLLPDVYAYRYDFSRVTPSMINDLEFCPRLLWTQRRLGLKLLSHRSLVPLVRGVLLHERYQRAVSQYDNVIVEYKIELGDLVGVVDLAVRRKGRLIPVEIKSGGVSREAHKRQLQIYVAMLGSKYGYLVYGRRVEIVHEDKSALETLEKIREVFNSNKPPPAKCGQCMFKPICQNVQHL
ncbi:MAG: CRISPR-associated protein Cas4 [Pyrobaculum sp.]